MNAGHLFAFLVVPAVSGALVGAGCTAILDPGEDRDGVERCGNVEGCSEPEDARYIAECVGASASVQGVCVAAFAPDVDCGRGNYEDDHPLNEYLSEFGQAVFYASDCSGDNRGTRGCPGPCKGELVVNVNDVCDEPGAFPPAVQATGDVVAADIHDQFCRSFFCDERFYCERSGDGEMGVCERCDPEAPYGEGGCGDLYISGERSCVYDEVADSCSPPVISPEEEDVNFGACADVRTQD